MNTTIISVISVCIAGVALIANLTDRFKKNSLELIEYRLNELDKSVKKILEKLDNYETEIDEKIEKAMNTHIALYHTRKKKGE